MSDRTTSPPATASPWPRRLAFSTLVAAVPLVFFGGTVTTLHAGLAIDGWLVLEPGRGDHFLWLYPVDKWFRDVGTFVEHTHRLFGSLVGLLAVATVVATWMTDRRRLPRFLSMAALLAVVAQGTIGGLRVLEQSERLAFLHGAIAQAVFAVLGASCVAASAAFSASSPSTRFESKARGSRVRTLSVFASCVIYVQIVAGAWLRHGGETLALAVHGVLAVIVVASTVLLARQMRLCAADLAADSGTGFGRTTRSRILVVRSWLIGLLVAQIVLGIAAFVVVWWPAGPNSKATSGLGSSVFPTLHVLVGGALLFACVAAAMFVHRLFPASSRGSGARTAFSPEALLEQPASLESARCLESAR